MDENTITQEILKKRTRELANSRHDVQTIEKKGLKLIVFALGNESYGLEANVLKNIQTMKNYIPIPGVAPFISGITSLFGVLYTIIDLKKFLEIEDIESQKNPKLIVVDHESLRVCFLIDRIIAFKTINEEALEKDITGIKSLKAGLIKGITSDTLIVLNSEKILKKIEKEAK